MPVLTKNQEQRLDAVETAFFLRELEAIDARVYEAKYAQYKARMLLPTQDGIGENDDVYLYRMFDGVGQADFIGNEADDLPSVDVKGNEFPTAIKQLGVSYRYSLREIRAAQRAGRPLDAMRAMRARRAMESKIDSILALGDSARGLKGVLSLSGTTSFTVSGNWGTLATADPEAVAADILGAVDAGVAATDEAFTQYTVTMPLVSYQLAAKLRFGQGSDTTVLDFVKQKSPYIARVEPWFRTETAGSGSTKRMACWPNDMEALAALVPQELQFLPPDLRNLAYVVNGTASCGGVVVRHPKSVVYADGI